MRECKICGETDEGRFCKGSTTWCTKCRALYNKEKSIYLKIKAIHYLGGSCSKCGYDKFIGALDFHHFDPEKKDELISCMVKRGGYWDDIKCELDKCELLCSNCHREVHNDIKYDYKFSFNIEEFYEIRKRKRKGGISKNPIVCKGCGNNFYDHIKRKYCSKACYNIDCRRVKVRPHKGDLKKMLDVKSYVEIGKEFGVSDNTIRNWAKSYGLPSRKKDLKNKID